MTARAPAQSRRRIFAKAERLGTPASASQTRSPGAYVPNLKTTLFATSLASLLGAGAGCGSSPPPATTPAPAPAPPAEPTPPPPPSPAKPKPEIGTWGFDTAGMDPSVPPGASFYRYADGRWLTSTQI